MKLDFFKLDGAGNDFVGLDFRARSLPGPAELSRMARLLTHRQKGVGGDGLLCLLPCDQAHFRMLYLNADGSIGEMCGNGARCAVVFAHHLGIAPAEGIRFETDAGPYEAAVIPGGARIRFPDLAEKPRTVALEGPGRPAAAVEFLRCGVPHAVVTVKEGLEHLGVEEDGRAIRQDPAFAPAGTNANFVQVVGEGSLRLRTYERGVEAETLACGTGAVASCCVHAHGAGAQGVLHYTVVPTGGEALTVELTVTAAGFEDVFLGGPARLVFRGEAAIDTGHGHLYFPA